MDLCCRASPRMILSVSSDSRSYRPGKCSHACLQPDPVSKRLEYNLLMMLLGEAYAPCHVLLAGALTCALTANCFSLKLLRGDPHHIVLYSLEKRFSARA